MQTCKNAWREGLAGKSNRQPSCHEGTWLTTVATQTFSFSFLDAEEPYVVQGLQLTTGVRVMWQLKIRANPKSASFTWPWLVTRMFSGFRSRCITRLEWRNARPHSNCLIKSCAENIYKYTHTKTAMSILSQNIFLMSSGHNHRLQSRDQSTASKLLLVCVWGIILQPGHSPGRFSGLGPHVQTPAWLWSPALTSGWRTHPSACHKTTKDGPRKLELHRYYNSSSHTIMLPIPQPWMSTDVLINLTSVR